MFKALFSMIIFPFFIGFIIVFLVYHLLIKKILIFLFEVQEKHRINRFVMGISAAFLSMFPLIYFNLHEIPILVFHYLLGADGVWLSSSWGNKELDQILNRLMVFGMVSFSFYNSIASPNSPRFESNNISDSPEILSKKSDGDIEIYSVEDYKEIMESNLKLGYTIVSYEQDVVDILRSQKSIKKQFIAATLLPPVLNLVFFGGLVFSMVGLTH